MEQTYLIDSTPVGVPGRERATYLADRGVDDAVARARGYRHVGSGNVDPTAKAAGIPDRYFEVGSSATAIPLYDLDGTLCVTQYRLGSPELMPEGRQRRFLLPSGATRGDFVGHIPFDVNPHPDNATAVRDKTVPLWITEGAPKADAILSAALREGIPIAATSFTGVSMPIKKGTDGSHDNLHPDTIGSPDWLDLIEERDVVLAFDADMWTKPQVAIALRKVARALIDAGARVKVAQLDPTGPKGIDDFLVWARANGRRKPLTGLARSAKPFDYVERKLVKSGVIAPTVETRPLGGVNLAQALQAWSDNIDVPAGEPWQAHLTWALDDDHNAYVRARTEQGAAALGDRWSLYPASFYAQVALIGEDAATQLVGEIVRSGRIDEAPFLLTLAADELAAELGATKTRALALATSGTDRDHPHTLDEAIAEVRRAGGGVELPAGSTKFAELRVVVSDDPQRHGLWSVESNGKGEEWSRLLPYIPAIGSAYSYRRLDADGTSTKDVESTAFTIRAVLPGGKVTTAIGVPVAATTDPIAFVQALRKHGAILPVPVGYEEKEAFQHCLNSVGLAAQSLGSAFSRSGYALDVDPTDDVARGQRWVFATIRGGIDADGVRPDVIASNGADMRAPGSGLLDYPKKVQLDDFATPQELSRVAEFFGDFLALAPARITAPVLGQFCNSLVPRSGDNPSVFLYGPSASRKSTLASLLPQALVPWRDGDERNMKSVSIYSDSLASASGRGAFGGHLPFVVDDYVNSAGDPEKKLAQAKLIQSVVTSAYEGADPGRATADGAARVDRQHVESPIITAEARDFLRGSRSTRTIVAEVTEPDTSAEKFDAFREKWYRDGTARRIIASLIRGVIRELDAGDTSRIDIRGTATRAIDWLELEGGSRVGQLLARLLSAPEILIHIAQQELGDGGGEETNRLFSQAFELSQPGRGLDALTAQEIAQFQRESNPTNTIAASLLSRVSDLITSCRAYLAAADGSVPLVPDRYGWVIDEVLGRERKFKPRSGATLIGQIDASGEVAVLFPSPVASILRDIDPTVTVADVRDQIAEACIEKFADHVRQNRTLSGLLRTDAGTNRIVRGYPVALESLGLEAERASGADDPRRVPVQHIESRTGKGAKF